MDYINSVTAGRSPLSQPPKSLMASWSSSGFSHLRPGVFHISLRTLKTQHTQPRRWKKRRTNNHRRREKFVTLLCSFLCISGLSRACSQAKFPQSHQERWLIPLTLANPASGSTGPCSRLPPTSVDCSLLWYDLLSAFFCSLWNLPSLVPLPVSWEISRASPLCEFHTKTDKGILWLALTPTPTETNATHRVTAGNCLKTV